MMYTRKLSAGVLATVYGVLFLWAMPCFGAQAVHVVWPMETGQRLLDVMDQARGEGFVLGVVQEADEMLSAPLTEERRALFAARIGDKTRDLVLSYKEFNVSEQADPHALVMDLSVRVNTPVLKGILKDLGIFYTGSASVPCALTLTGLGSEDWQRLEDLQTLTGVDVIMGGNQDTTVPAMRLSKIAANRWQGELTAFDTHFSGQGTTLDGVWSDLWKQYFKLPHVISGVFATVVFEVEGWYVTDGVEYFENILQSWDKIVEEATLVSLKMPSESLGGVWSVQTLDVQALRTRLETFLGSRGLHLVFFRQEKV